jgi:hypothetical protein
MAEIDRRSAIASNIAHLGQQAGDVINLNAAMGGVVLKTSCNQGAI